MKAVAWIVLVIASLSPRYGCHKPTTAEVYAHANRCFAALDANLASLSPESLGKAGLDAKATRQAALGYRDTAHRTGRELGRSWQQVAGDLRDAKTAYTAAHRFKASGTGWTFRAGGNRVRDCLGDVYGRPND